MTTTPSPPLYRIVRAPSACYEPAIRSLFQRSNDAAGVATVFTQWVLQNGELKAPYDNYEKHGGAMWVAVDDQDVLAFVAVRVDELPLGATLEIQHLIVDSAWWRRGIGTALMTEARKFAESYRSQYRQRFMDARLTLTCLGTNDGALAFYKAIPWLQQQGVEKRQSARDGRRYELVHFIEIAI
jgi:ribosomal protein S18 acetylase RimI-like enzyme